MRLTADQGRAVGVETIEVPAHTTNRMTVPAEGGDWIFTYARTGCLRVQRGDFTAYVPKEAIAGLALFLQYGNAGGLR